MILLNHRKLWTLLIIITASVICNTSKMSRNTKPIIHQDSRNVEDPHNRSLEDGAFPFQTESYISIESCTNDKSSEFVYTVAMATRHTGGHTTFKLRASKMTEKERALYGHLEKVFHSYLHGTVGFVAVAGNALSLMVLLQNKKQKVSPYTYMAFLAVMDLVSGIIGVWNAVLSNTTLLSLSSVARWLFYHTFVPTYTVSEISYIAASLLAMVLGIDRMIAVQFPLKRASWCIVPRARGISVVIVILSIILNLHTPFRLTVIWAWNAKSGLMMPRLLFTSIGLNTRVNVAARCISFIFGLLMPLLVMMVTSTITLYKLSQSRHFRSTITSQETTKHGSNLCYGITIGVIFAFIITQTPETVLLFMAMLHLMKMKGNFPIEVFTLVGQLLAFSNSAVNFFIYAAFNKHFRRDVHFLFRSRRREDVYQSNQDHNTGSGKTTDTI